MQTNIKEKPFLMPVGNTISSAWQKVNGVKGTIWRGLSVVILIAFIFFILEKMTASTPVLTNSIYTIGFIINFLLQMGLIYFGIQRAFDLPMDYHQMFRTFNFNMIIRLFGLVLLQLLIFLPFVMLSILGMSILGSDFLSYVLIGVSICLAACFGVLYVAIRMMLSAAFILDKKNNPWQAVKKSFEASRSNFWRLLQVFIMGLLIFILSFIPFGIGLIWSLPFLLICYGLMYKRLLVNVASP
jgi:hypothetical protein